MVSEWNRCLAPACKKKFQNAGDSRCPFCGSSDIEVFGDEEDIDATTNDYTDQFKETGQQSHLLGSGMKEKRADYDGKGEVEELKLDENFHVDPAKMKIFDELLPEIPE